MSKKIVYKNAIGNLCIITPTGLLPIEDVLTKDVPPDATDVHIVDSSAIPEDRTYRNAWQLEKKKVSVDMKKARAIHMDKLRTLRDAKLKQLDTDYLIADESGDPAKKAAIKALKEKLRDMPNKFDLSQAQDPEQLKSLVPDYLGA